MLSLPSLFLTTLLAVQAPTASDSIPGRALVLPVVAWSERTGVQYGGAAFRSHATAAGDRSSSDAAYVARTAQGYAKAYLQLERWTGGDARRFRLRVSYQSYPLPFYGIGASTPDVAEEWFSRGVSMAHLLSEWALRPGDYLHLAARVTRSRLRESEPGGAVDLGEVPFSSGSLVSQLEVGLVHDTRDHPGTPRRGTYVRGLVATAQPEWGSDHRSSRLTMDARRYLPIGTTGVLAGQVQFDAVRGDVPFDQLPMVGADSAMRGYPVGRFRDRQAMTAQVEFRSGYWRRVGVVGFVGAGTVAANTGDFASGPWYPTVGLGGRLLIGPRSRSVLRADVAVGRGSFGFSFGLGEAF
jgi:outer membrane protein assembly factor BamA